MKTLLLKASPNPTGNTSTLADRLADGLRSVGHGDICEFRLNDLNLRPCQGCNRCLEPPYEGCVLDDDFQTIYPSFREADLIVFAAPVYWWHLCAQMKTFIDRMHPMLTFDREHCLPTKHLVLITAHLAQDPYGVELAIKMLESISGWAGMEFDAISFHSENRAIQDAPEKLDEAYALGRSFADWTKPTLATRCLLGDECGFLFRSPIHAARHVVMASGEKHLEWKAKHLSEVHTLQNTDALVQEALAIARQRE